MKNLKFWGILGAAVGMVAFFVAVREILLPFVLGALFAYLFNPMVSRLAQQGAPRVVGSALTVALTFGALVSLLVVGVPMLSKNAAGFAQNVPEYVNWLKTEAVPLVQTHFGIEIDRELVLRKLENSGTQLFAMAMIFARKAMGTGANVADFFSLVLVTPLVMFYMLQNWPNMTAWVASQLPRRRQTRILETLQEIDVAMAAFLRGQGTVCLFLGCFYGGALWLAGLDFGLVIGLATGLLAFIPFVGMALGLLAAGLVAIVQYQFTTVEPYLILAAIFAAGQVVESFWLTPKLVGRSVGIHPVWVIFAVLAGSALAGFLGILLALPVATLLAVLLPKGFVMWRESAVYKKG